MASEPDGIVLRSIRTLFDAGTVGGLSDAQLLDRFLSRRDEGAEVAFEALVVRHGPMVLDVCRNVLRDPHDALDAFQATFLVLARKARSIRRREALASWLFGVARRVASRARSDAARRRTHERRGAELKATGDEPCEEPQDLSALHEKVGRLPEKYREPVVLCYLKGMTYEAAARHLGCPVGTLGVRLKRAKERLRSRLTRRGWTIPARFLIAGATPKSAAAAIPAPLVESTTRAAMNLTAGKAAAGMVSAAVLSLTQGALKSMFLTKVKVIGLCVASLGLVIIGAGTFVGQAGRAEDGKAEAPTSRAGGSSQPQAEPVLQARPVEAANRREEDRRLVEIARRRVEAQRKFYEEGRITIDRFLDALAQLMHAEVQAAATRDEKVAAVQSYLDRVKEVVVRERAELEVGRSTAADVEEANLRREQAEVDLRRARTSSGPVDLESLDRRLSDIERKLDLILRSLPPAPPPRR